VRAPRDPIAFSDSSGKAIVTQETRPGVMTAPCERSDDLKDRVADARRQMWPRVLKSLNSFVQLSASRCAVTRVGRQSSRLFTIKGPIFCFTLFCKFFRAWCLGICSVSLQNRHPPVRGNFGSSPCGLECGCHLQFIIVPRVPRSGGLPVLQTSLHGNFGPGPQACRGVSSPGSR